MCDVDEEAVVAAADAPSIYDIPKVLHREGLDAYVVRRLGLPFRDVDWTEWDDLLRRVHPPRRSHRRAGRQVHRPARRLPLGHRGAAGRRVRPRRQGRHPLGRLRRVRDPEGAAKHLAGVDAVCVPAASASAASRASSARSPTPASNGIPTSGSASACSAWSSSTPATWPASRRRASTEFDPDPRPGDRDHGRAADVVEGERRPRRHHAAGLYPAKLAEGSVVARSTARRTSRSGTGTATRSTTPTASSSRRPAWSSPAPRPDGQLVEFVELPRDVHPYYVATQAHPELRSPPTRPHPLFAGLVGAGDPHLPRPPRRRARPGRRTR
jgi:CTP synthase